MPRMANSPQTLQWTAVINSLMGSGKLPSLPGMFSAAIWKTLLATISMRLYMGRRAVLSRTISSARFFPCPARKMVMLRFLRRCLPASR